MQHNPRLIWFDFIRAACAILVCAGHLRSVVFVEFSDLSHPSFLEKVFYFTTGLGHQSVMVFFVLSGFFVGGSVLRSGIDFNMNKYLIARLSRLWTVLIPALLFTAAVDTSLSLWAPDVLKGAFSSFWHSGPGESASYAAGPSVFAANLLFLQTIVAPVYGTNGPLWSLANEFWYYILFPLGFIALRGFHQGMKLPVWLRALVGIAGLLLIRVLPTGIDAGFLIWIFGILVYQMQGTFGARTRRVILTTGLLASIGALVYSKLEGLESRFLISPDFVVGSAFTLLLIGLSCGRSTSTSLTPAQKPIELLSASSFSLYLFHFPVVVLIGTFVYKGHNVEPSFNELAVFGLWLGALIAIGYGFYLLFERNTDKVRRMTNRLIGRSLSATS